MKPKLHPAPLAMKVNSPPVATSSLRHDMGITKVALRNFKRFDDEAFELKDCIVIAGPNNSGKTTLLQAIAAWHFALTRWRGLNDYQRHGGAYAKEPIARQAFNPVPLRNFDLLWHQRNTRESIQITVTFVDGVEVPIEIIDDTTEQVYVRPLPTVEPALLKDAERFPGVVFIPAMTGLTLDEPVYQWPRIDQLLARGKPGDVLRNLLLDVHLDEDQSTWNSLVEAIKAMFGYTLLPPSAYGPSIIAEYQHPGDDKRYDLASAGSGFLQVLMLLTFLKSRPGSILLLDEPDAHLYILMKERIYRELRRAAWESKSQLIISTHSEVFINSVAPEEVCALVP